MIEQYVQKGNEITLSTNRVRILESGGAKNVWDKYGTYSRKHIKLDDRWIKNNLDNMLKNEYAYTRQVGEMIKVSLENGEIPRLSEAKINFLKEHGWIE